MAATAHSREDEKAEFFDSPEELASKLDQLAEWIKGSKHFIAFTGAGISTSCGIPDFRSGMNTSLEVGAGVWELRAAKAARPAAAARKTKSTLQAIPSGTHMALKAMHEAGYLKFLISQNTDGLHRRNLEYCKKCGKQVLRDFHARRRGNKVHDHRTGRPCPACGAKTMHDTIINFGESLPERELEAGFAHGEAADLCVVLGSSLRVTPAADMPLATAERGGRLVIVNLQKTPMDDAAALVIHAKTDDVSAGLAERLGLQPAAFRLTRRMCVRCRAVRPAPGKPVALQVSIEAVDADGLPFSCIQAARLRVSETTVTSYAVDADGSSRQLASSATTKQRPVADTTAVFDMTPVSVGRASAASGTAAVLRWQGVVSAQVQFRGHYAEPVLDLALPLDLCVSAPGGSMSQTTEVATSLLAELEPAAGGASEGGLRGAHGAGRLLHATFDPLGSEGWEALTDGGEVDWSKSAAAVAAERQYKGGQAVTK